MASSEDSLETINARLAPIQQNLGNDSTLNFGLLLEQLRLVCQRADIRRRSGRHTRSDRRRVGCRETGRGLVKQRARLLPCSCFQVQALTTALLSSAELGDAEQSAATANQLETLLAEITSMPRSATIDPSVWAE
jgi:hypothetical protein